MAKAKKEAVKAEVAEEAVKAEVAEEAVKEWKIAPGKSLTTKRGIKVPGAVVVESDFSSKEVFEGWKKKKVIV